MLLFEIIVRCTHKKCIKVLDMMTYGRSPLLQYRDHERSLLNPEQKCKIEMGIVQP